VIIAGFVTVILVMPCADTVEVVSGGIVEPAEDCVKDESALPEVRFASGFVVWALDPLSGGVTLCF